MYFLFQRPLKSQVISLNDQRNIQCRRMDTETKRIVCKRKLDEKKEELKIEKETLAKKRKEKVDSVERSEKTVKWFQKVIEEKEEEVEKIKVEKNDKLLFITSTAKGL